MNIENAIIIAMKAHYGQKDKCGDPYILHPLWVMSRMYTEDEKVCAVLHEIDNRPSFFLLKQYSPDIFRQFVYLLYLSFQYNHLCQ